MKEIEELIQICERIVNRLDNLSKLDKKFNTEIGMYLEQMNSSMHKQTNNLKEIYETYGE